jgi:hypothetical protein
MEASVKTSAWEKIGEDGMLQGRISISITEEADVRESRDGALRALDEVLTINKNLIAAETKMRARITDAGNAFYKEREAHCKEIATHATTKALLSQMGESHKRLCARVEELQAQLKAATATPATNKAKRASR